MDSILKWCPWSWFERSLITTPKHTILNSHHRLATRYLKYEMLPFLFYFQKVDESRFSFSYSFSLDALCSINRNILLLFLYQSLSGSPSTTAEYRLKCSNILKSIDRRGSKKRPSAEASHVYNVFLTVHAPFWRSLASFSSSKGGADTTLQKGAAPKSCPVRKRPKCLVRAERSGNYF